MVNLSCTRVALFLLLAVTAATAAITVVDGPTCGEPAIHPVFNATLQTTRVRGGEEAVPGSWPWQVRIGIRTPLGIMEFICGGTIIDQRHILTAAHCFRGQSFPFQSYFIRVGEHHINVQETGQREYAVSKVISHPEFSMPETGPKNDIAILKLATPIVYSAKVEPVCLPEPDSDAVDDRVCVVTGWGSTVNQVTGNPRTSSLLVALSSESDKAAAPAQPIMKPSPVLKQAVLPILYRAYCRAVWGFVQITDNMICTAAENLDREPCQGDSGGPLVCESLGNADRYVQEGVVSFGAGCGQGGPAVFTRVGKYHSWIKSVTDSVVTTTITHD